jgi:poly(A) polymerase/tRNA nucleotidyltransferase (CCA-adding enzyme)
MDLIEIVRNKIPQHVTAVAGQLQENGFEAYLVGGSVRDLILGRQPQDYDIATNATPEEVTGIFPKSIPTGAQFGTIRVLVENEQGETVDIEVTTYRSEADYYGGRWPAKVEFAKKIEDDLARRDFTMNAIAVRLDGQLDQADIADPFKGVEDIKNKIVRAVGDPVARFSEDGLRPIRACRLAANLGFQIEEETFNAIAQTLTIVDNISAERVRDELNKLLLKSPKPSIGFEYMRKSGLLKIILPELLEGIDVVQPDFHSDDVYTHTLKAIDIAEDSVKLAALFHDIAKPRTRSEDEKGVHFYGHDVMGSKMTIEIMRRLKYSGQEIDRTARLVRWHMFYYPNADWRKKYTDSTYLSDDELEIVRQEQEGENEPIPGGWSDAAVRRFIRNVGGEDLIDDLMKLRIADASANPKNAYNPEELVVLTERIAKIRSQDMALKVADLDVDGHDMQQLGLKGPQIGRMLSILLDEVIEEPKLNDKNILLELAARHLSKVLK